MVPACYSLCTLFLFSSPFPPVTDSFSSFVPQDMATLVTALGGPDVFVSRLSFLHTSGLLYVGDEQAFLPVFQFHYAGRPGLSGHFARSYIPSQFNDTVGGIPGNDDSGAM